MQSGEFSPSSKLVSALSMESTRDDGLSDEDILQKRFQFALDQYTEKATCSAIEARATLVREGIYLSDGQLSPDYWDSGTCLE